MYSMWSADVKTVARGGVQGVGTRGGGGVYWVLGSEYPCSTGTCPNTRYLALIAGIWALIAGTWA